LEDGATLAPLTVFGMRPWKSMQFQIVLCVYGKREESKFAFAYHSDK